MPQVVGQLGASVNFKLGSTRLRAFPPCAPTLGAGQSLLVPFVAHSHCTSNTVSSMTTEGADNFNVFGSSHQAESTVAVDYLRSEYYLLFLLMFEKLSFNPSIKHDVFSALQPQLNNISVESVLNGRVQNDDSVGQKVCFTFSYAIFSFLKFIFSFQGSKAFHVKPLSV
ncbi:unnamed protein product [Toxocara canis]|uniref:SERPIN domain-containing protein n=1 Tax=Toxocara canis TaxID=6265 RepID=A0A183VCW2_TOXCA|nr:unnamed protein product [Toxocara canis]